MEKEIKKQIKKLFTETKEFERERKRCCNGLIKGFSDNIGILTLANDFAIRDRLFTITVLLKILLNNKNLHDVHLGDLGKKHIYLSYFDGEILKGIKYKV